MSTTKTVLGLLHPVCRERFERLTDELDAHFRLGIVGTHFCPFEGYRDPDRQATLFKQRPRVTKANAWQSPHQYGLACDFVPKGDGGWTWETTDWPYLHAIAMKHGLLGIGEWDKAHIEAPEWKMIKHVLIK